ncbi:23 kDa jasmonate-induced protein-like [Camellia sinensis]|uniref:23 kDa jasmonate-induced protein-like n=1 Tax=Camellia sinensis TaxID=4442 RepID=UPI0010360C19|nr:23 kDa jasmonate-induced protein-like [Camellia sinensis]XP_028095123.1 23 kDa jasmonate-induced protein-like [Camellia sinensis]XP_028095125.1 23 kDa jasmonate-induced protein-like [Camellia sinensis]
MENDQRVRTDGNIRNKTKGSIAYSVKHDFSGKLAKESTYPPKIEDDQPGVFNHEETSGEKTGSCGAVVYRGKNKNGKDCDWMFSWSNPNPIHKENKVFTAIAEGGYYPADTQDPIWHDVHKELMKSGTTSTSEWNGCISSMTSTPDDVNNCVDVKGTASLA